MYAAGSGFPGTFAGAERGRWRRLASAAAALGAVAASAPLLPWLRTVEISDGDTDVDIFNAWNQSPASSGSGSTGAIGLAADGQWGLLVVTAALTGVLCSLVARGQHPADPRLRMALQCNALAAALGLVFAATAWVTAASGPTMTATPQIGWILSVVAMAGWLPAAVLMWRAAGTARGSRP